MQSRSMHDVGVCSVDVHSMGVHYMGMHCIDVPSMGVYETKPIFSGKSVTTVFDAFKKKMSIFYY